METSKLITDVMVGKYERLAVYFEKLTHPNNTLSYLMTNTRENILSLMDKGDRACMLDFMETILPYYETKYRERREELVVRLASNNDETRQNKNPDEILVIDARDYCSVLSLEKLSHLNYPNAIAILLTMTDANSLKNNEAHVYTKIVFQLIELLKRFPKAYIQVNIESLWTPLTSPSSTSELEIEVLKCFFGYLMYNEDAMTRIIWVYECNMHLLEKMLETYYPSNSITNMIKHGEYKTMSSVFDIVLKNHLNFYRQKKMFYSGNPEESVQEFV